MKDAALLSRCDDPELRRIWRCRIEDHDGGVDEGGGIRRWLKLSEAAGLDIGYVASTKGVLPATRFAVDAYVRFVSDKTLLEAVASSLTELFAPAIHSERIAGLIKHYSFANEQTLSYFRQRLEEAPGESAFGLQYVLDKADTIEKQNAAADALVFKTDVLWSQLDALYAAYVMPGTIPPGAWNASEAVIIANEKALTSG
jgi:pyrroloquinoline-quinone synthase